MPLAFQTAFAAKYSRATLTPASRVELPVANATTMDGR